MAQYSTRRFHGHSTQCASISDDSYLIVEGVEAFVGACGVASGVKEPLGLLDAILEQGDLLTEFLHTLLRRFALRWLGRERRMEMGRKLVKHMMIRKLVNHVIIF